MGISYRLVLVFYFVVTIDSQKISDLHRKMPRTHYPDYPKDNILQNYSPLSKPGNGHCHNTRMWYFV